MDSDTGVFRQLLSGRDVAVSDLAARQMVNFSYLLGDAQSGTCLLVDPSWAPLELLELADGLGLEVVGVLATHRHADHVGGSLYGHPVPGVRELLGRVDCPLYAHEAELDAIRHSTGVALERMRGLVDGDHVPLGGQRVEVLHTPGHSPGSVCYRVGDRLLTGDTLFMQGCGRVDLPGSDPHQMLHSLKVRLAALPGHLTVFPGHDYGGASATLAALRQTNPYL